jgi:hypothetical protein
MKSPNLHKVYQDFSESTKETCFNNDIPTIVSELEIGFSEYDEVIGEQKSKGNMLLKKVFEKELKKIRERIQKLIILIYQNYDDINIFEKKIDSLSFLKKYKRLERIGEKNDTPSPYEAIKSTIVDLKIISKIKESCSEHSDAISISGSLAWGPFIEVKGQKPLKEIKAGSEKIEDPSDLDLFIIYKNPEKLRKIIKSLVSDKLIPPEEIERLNIFQKYKRSDKNLIFCTLAFLEEIQQDYYFIDQELFNKISELNNPDLLVDKNGIKFIRRFNSRPSRSERRSVSNLDRDNEIDFETHSKSMEGGNHIIDCMVSKREENEIYFHFIIFAFLFGSNYIHDPNNTFKENEKKLIQSIRKNYHNYRAQPARHERMPKVFYNRILERIL